MNKNLFKNNRSTSTLYIIIYINMYHLILMTKWVKFKLKKKYMYNIWMYIRKSDSFNVKAQVFVFAVWLRSSFNCISYTFVFTLVSVFFIFSVRYINIYRYTYVRALYVYIPGNGNRYNNIMLTVLFLFLLIIVLRKNSFNWY